MGFSVSKSVKSVGSYVRRGAKSVGRSPITQKVAETALNAAIPMAGDFAGAVYNPGEKARMKEAASDFAKAQKAMLERVEAEYRLSLGLEPKQKLTPRQKRELNRQKQGMKATPHYKYGRGPMTAKQELYVDPSDVAPYPPAYGVRDVEPPKKRGFFGGIGQAFKDVFGGI